MTCPNRILKRSLRWISWLDKLGCHCSFSAFLCFSSLNQRISRPLLQCVPLFLRKNPLPMRAASPTFLKRNHPPSSSLKPNPLQCVLPVPLFKKKTSSWKGKSYFLFSFLSFLSFLSFFLFFPSCSRSPHGRSICAVPLKIKISSFQNSVDFPSK